MAGGIAVKITPVEELFTVVNETATLLQEELNCSYLEALAETGENLFQEAVIQDELSELSAKRLKKAYDSINLSRFTKEEIRKVFSTCDFKRNERKCSAQSSDDSRYNWNVYRILTKEVYQKQYISIIGSGSRNREFINSSDQSRIR